MFTRRKRRLGPDALAAEAAEAAAGRSKRQAIVLVARAVHVGERKIAHPLSVNLIRDWWLPSVLSYLSLRQLCVFMGVSYSYFTEVLHEDVHRCGARGIFGTFIYANGSFKPSCAATVPVMITPRDRTHPSTPSPTPTTTRTASPPSYLFCSAFFMSLGVVQVV
jgi:hypothetical protein